jgi:hypothetical protein
MLSGWPSCETSTGVTIASQAIRRAVSEGTGWHQSRSAARDPGSRASVATSARRA